MSAAPQLIAALEPLPAAFSASIYLAGAGAWHEEALRLLQAAGYEGLVFLPEPRGPAADEDALHHWRDEAQRHADAVLCWFPEDPEERARTAEVYESWGSYRRSGRVVLGVAAPPRHRALVQQASRLRVPFATSLAEAVSLALPLLTPGALRRGGERAVPLLLWRSPAFQRWYRALRAAGNRLDDVEVEWTYRPRSIPGRPPLVFALRPRVFIRAERRYKAGEVVVGRSEVSATVLYYPAPRREDTLVVLVREFRSAVSHPSGYVWELPGGSAENAAERDHDPLLTAAREVQQETGLLLPPAQLELVQRGPRQLAATILSHRAHLYRARLTPEQLELLRGAERSGRYFGANPGERCFVGVHPLGEILQNDALDWSQLGMILAALPPEAGPPRPASRPPPRRGRRPPD